MYTGRCSRLSDLALDLLAAADRFAMPGLKDIAEQVFHLISFCNRIYISFVLQNLRAHLSVETVCRTLAMADLHSASDLKNDAVRFIATHSNSVLQACVIVVDSLYFQFLLFQTDGWQCMVSSKPDLVTEVVQAISEASSEYLRSPADSLSV